jgi:trk system potassium uptake protein TrkA
LRDGVAEVIEAEALETSSVVGVPLRDVQMPTGVIVGAVVRGEQVIIPRGDTVIEVGDRVVVMALAEMVRKVEKMFSVQINFF